ncbi:MAG: HEAT repeat domain-containing protein [Anaerolineae bacterium]|nr:HEAT repeat domain-containing protein [Anaerolineae bacterium]
MNQKDETQIVPPSVQYCIDNLQSPNPRQRSQAAQDLGELRDLCTVEVLITVLGEDINTYVRSAAAEALGHIGAPEAIFPLMDALHDSSSFVRRAAAIALGQMQAKEAQMALLQALEDPNFYVRRAAINAIGKLGISDLGNVLLPLLDTPDPRIQRTVITALRRLRNKDAVPQFIRILDEYLTVPSHKNLPVVKTLVIALGDLRAQEAVPTLIRVVRGYVGVRSLAVMALGQIGSPEAGPILIEALKDKSTNLRLSALKSLGQLKYEAALPAVLPFLSAPDPRVRRVAAMTCGYLGDHKAVAVLMEMVKEDPSPLVRPVALEALSLVGDARLLPQLIELAGDTNAYLRAALADTLLALHDGRTEVVTTLQQLTKDPVEHVATAAKHALAEVENQEPRQSKKVTEESGAVKRESSWLQRLFGRS